MFYLILGDFNAQSHTWWDDDKISLEGKWLDPFSSLFISWFISTNKRTNVFTVKFSLMYRSYIYKSTKLGYRQRFSLRLQQSWHKKIKKSIEQVHWENIFDHKNCHQQAAIFNLSIHSQTLYQIAGPFRRFSTRVWQNACINILSMWWCVMHIFLFLRFYNFTKGILHIYTVFFKKLRPLFLYVTYELV